MTQLVAGEAVELAVENPPELSSLTLRLVSARPKQLPILMGAWTGQEAVAPFELPLAARLLASVGACACGCTVPMATPYVMMMRARNLIQSTRMTKERSLAMVHQAENRPPSDCVCVCACVSCVTQG